MSYPSKGNKLEFFEPIMAVAANDTKPLCAVDIGAANATHGEFVCVRPCTIREAQFVVSLEAVVGTTTAPYVVLTKYTTPAAGGTATTIGTITVPTGTAVGKVVRKSSLSTSFAIGDVVQIKHVIGTGGTVTGQGSVNWVCEPNDEVAGNNSDISSSST
jgi:hypothetical protein